MEGDDRIKTDLLPSVKFLSKQLNSCWLDWRHQKEALDYMVQRENGPIPSEFCLWKAVEDDVDGWWDFFMMKVDEDLWCWLLKVSSRNYER
jgi:hypothetical protein